MANAITIETTTVTYSNLDNRVFLSPPDYQWVARSYREIREGELCLPLLSRVGSQTGSAPLDRNDWNLMPRAEEGLGWAILDAR